MTTLFLDTSFILALELADEQYHLTAQRYWEKISQMNPRFVKTSYVFDETVTFLNSRRQHDKALEVGNRLLQNSIVQIVHIDETQFLDDWKHFQSHSDKSYSLTDCISFLIMKRFNILTALTFDRHFSQEEFIKEPL